MDLSVVIVSYNTFALTREAVETARASGDRARLRHEVIVVDNASPDRSGPRLAETFAHDPHVTVVCNDGNPGFSAANNQGAALSSGRNLFFLNPDTRTLGDALGTLVAYLDAHPGAGAVGPRVLNADGSDQPSVGFFPTAARLVRHYLPVLDGLRGHSARQDAVLSASAPVEVVNGCALALRRDAFEAVGGWNEGIFMYAEEDELCLHLARAGRAAYFLREAEIVHLGGQSTAERFAEQQVVVQRSYAAFLHQHFPHLVALDRLLGTVGFGLRAVVYALWLRRSPDDPALRQRYDAARRLARWYRRSYA